MGSSESGAEYSGPEVRPRRFPSVLPGERRARPTPDPTLTSTHDPTTATVLAHAVRRWEAEVENASRLSNRENGILGVIAMLLGLGLFRRPEVRELEPTAILWIARTLLATSIALVLAALGMVMWVRGAASASLGMGSPRPSFASALLTWPGAPRHMREVVLDEHEANLIAIRVTTAAVTDLLDRNTRRKRLLDASQRFLFGAAASAGLALTCYQ